MAAHAVVDGLEAHALNPDIRLFERYFPHSEVALYNKEKPNVAVWGKDSWYQLVFASLASKKSLKEIKSTLESNGVSDPQLLDAITKQSKEELCEFLDTIEDRIKRDMEKNWRFKDFAQGFIQSLEELQLKAIGGDLDAKKELDEQLRERTQAAFEEAKTKLLSVLNL